jgi:hypothetical protein
VEGMDDSLLQSHFRDWVRRGGLGNDEGKKEPEHSKVDRHGLKSGRLDRPLHRRREEEIEDLAAIREPSSPNGRDSLRRGNSAFVDSIPC